MDGAEAISIRAYIVAGRLSAALSTNNWSTFLIRLLANSLKIVSIVVLAILVAGGSVWFFNYWVDREQPMNVGRSVVIAIAEEDDTSAVAKKLEDADLITQPWYFENKMRFSDVELRPGTYNLQVGMSTNQIIKTITVAATGDDEDADSTTVGPERPEFSVTFIEGQRIEQNGAVLESAGMPGAAAEYTELANDIDYWRDAYSFLADVPSSGTLEGFLFPSTYTVPSNATVASVIDYQLSTFESNLTDDLKSGFDAQGLSVFEAVTLASIVEREAAVALERPMIAEVYLNRFKDGTTLNADPSQQFGVGTGDDWWPALNTEMLEKSKTTPYDTYNRERLPPGPIANPGTASLQAVAQPTTEGYMFFVTKGDYSGEHVFTFTLEEHEAATCREHPDWASCQ